MFDNGRVAAEPLYPAPRNAVGPPRTGPDAGKHYQGRQLVLARLVWRDRVEVVPGVAIWREAGHVCVEWSPRRGTTRQTWLLEADVRPRMQL